MKTWKPGKHKNLENLESQRCLQNATHTNLSIQIESMEVQNSPCTQLDDSLENF